MRKFLTAILGVALLVAAFGVAPAAATDYDGQASLSACSLGNGYSGGIELFNDDGQSGGSRIWCVPLTGGDLDTHFADFTPKSGDSAGLSDVGSFNNKAESVILRANPGCAVVFIGYDWNTFGGGVVWSDGVSYAEENKAYYPREIPTSADNDIASAEFLGTC